MKFNPFRPNSIATDELFQGRSDEMQFIERSLFQTKNGNPQQKIFIAGHKGMVGSAVVRSLEKAGCQNLMVISFK
jgi:tRNA A37 threonylcarbamoyladenosine dehydratase